VIALSAARTAAPTAAERRPCAVVSRAVALVVGDRRDHLADGGIPLGQLPEHSRVRRWTGGVGTFAYLEVGHARGKIVIAMCVVAGRAAPVGPAPAAVYDPTPG
jgi:hypothetical protein